MAQSDFPELRGVFDRNREVVRMLKAEKQLTDKQIAFTAVYTRLGKRVSETKDRTSLTAFTAVITGRYKVCQPDTITISWLHNETAEKLFEHTCTITRSAQAAPLTTIAEEMPAPVTGFQGLGEAEVNNLVEKRLTEMRQREEYERMREENQKMQVQIAELEGRNADLEHDMAARQTTESYMKIIGMALPGLSRFFGGAGLLSMLAGTDEPGPEPAIGNPATPPAPEPKDEREEMIQMLKDYMTDELSQQEVASLYLMFMEIQKDKSRIQQILNHITRQHETPTTPEKAAAAL